MINQYMGVAPSTFQVVYYIYKQPYFNFIQTSSPNPQLIPKNQSVQKTHHRSPGCRMPIQSGNRNGSGKRKVLRESSRKWVFPKIGVLQNGWFIWKSLLKWMIMIWGYHHFRKHPNDGWMVKGEGGDAPWKINGWNIISLEVWWKDHFSFQFMGDGCRFQPLIFQGDTSHCAFFSWKLFTLFGDRWTHWSWYVSFWVGTFVETSMWREASPDS